MKSKSIVTNPNVGYDSGMKELTTNQKKVLAVLQDPTLKRPPSFDTIAKEARLSSRGSVGSILKALRAKGYL